MAVQPRRPIDVDALADAVLADRRADLARAITLVESKRADHRAAEELHLVVGNDRLCVKNTTWPPNVE